jgi:hypothetical protein
VLVLVLLLVLGLVLLLGLGATRDMGGCEERFNIAPGGYRASSTRSLTLAARTTATACFAAYSGF